MLEKTNWESSKAAAILQAGLILVLLLWLAAAAFGQTAVMKTEPRAKTTATAAAAKAETPKTLMPVYKNYRAITIGMTADEVKDKLGKAKIQNAKGFYYQFADGEAAQIKLDDKKKVRNITITYADGNAPKFEDVFGGGAVAEPKANGSVYHIVSYPSAGYWVAYSKTAGDKPFVAVTMQKMRAAK